MSQSSKGTFNKVVSSVTPQTKMSALRRTVAVNMSASTPLGATVVSAEVALCCMRTNMTVKKVFHLRLLPFFLSEHGGSPFVTQTQSSNASKPFYDCGEACLLSHVFLQLAVITL